VTDEGDVIVKANDQLNSETAFGELQPLHRLLDGVEVRLQSDLGRVGLASQLARRGGTLSAKGACAGG